ncbi:MAG TPA: VOC family protein, partial [Spirochaetia bacterium]
EHTGIMTADIPALAEWYVTKLGFSLLFRSREAPFVTMLAKGDGMLIELFPWKEGFDGPPDARMRQVAHLCLTSTDIDADVRELKGRGVVVEGSPVPIFNGGRAAFFRDPEGNYLHLVERPRLPWK